VLQTRKTRWAAALSRRIADGGVTPNQISVASIFCAFLTAACFVEARNSHGTAQAAWLLSVALTIQARLLCNLLDGMVAVECGRKSKTGDIYNDFPDRVSDIVTLVAAGYAASCPYGPIMGWMAAVLALFTAYVRLLGGSLGTPQYFIGPMAKQHRMAALTVGCIIAAGLAAAHMTVWGIDTALAVIIAGAIVTSVRRIRRIASDLESR
jgi:phosphatidylglycerophosphate synthase